MSDTADFFRSRLDHMIDLGHPLAVLASRMPWQEIEASVAHLFPPACAPALLWPMSTSSAAPPA